MITSENFRSLLKKLNFASDLCESLFTYEFKTCRLAADFTTQKLIYPEQMKGREHNNSFSANENFVTWGREFDKALNDMKTDGGQLFSYW